MKASFVLGEMSCVVAPGKKVKHRSHPALFLFCTYCSINESMQRVEFALFISCTDTGLQSPCLSHSGSYPGFRKYFVKVKSPHSSLRGLNRCCCSNNSGDTRMSGAWCHAVCCAAIQEVGALRRPFLQVRGPGLTHPPHAGLGPKGPPLSWWWQMGAQGWGGALAVQRAGTSET